MSSLWSLTPCQPQGLLGRTVPQVWAALSWPGLREQLMGCSKGRLDPVVGLGVLKPKIFLSPCSLQTWKPGGTMPTL